MPTNFELKQLKPKLDIVDKPENPVHKLTDSNGALMGMMQCGIKFCLFLIVTTWLYLIKQINLYALWT